MTLKEGVCLNRQSTVRHMGVGGLAKLSYNFYSG